MFVVYKQQTKNIHPVKHIYFSFQILFSVQPSHASPCTKMHLLYNAIFSNPAIQLQACHNNVELQSGFVLEWTLLRLGDRAYSAPRTLARFKGAASWRKER